jgi:hypothetical protein
MRAPALRSFASISVATVFTFGILLLSLKPSVAVSQQEDAAALRELAERMLTSSVGTTDAQRPSARLLPGQLPPDLPLDLAIPDGSRIIGSVVRTGDQTGGMSVVIDVPGTLWDVHRYFEGVLSQQGWATSASGGISVGGGGFQQTSTLGNFYCRSGDDNSFLMVRLFDGPPGLVDVRFALTTAASPGPGGRSVSPCAATALSPYGSTFRKELLPPLTAPVGAQLRTTGQSGGMGSWGSDAMVETAVGVAALQAHFGEQLAAAGWVHRAAGSDGPLAWTLWDIPGESEWYGLLVVLEMPLENQRAVSLRAMAATDEGLSPGFPSSPFWMGVP